MMLYPSMSTLLDRINSRYLLVNVIAKRSREISEEAQQNMYPSMTTGCRMRWRRPPQPGSVSAFPSAGETAAGRGWSSPSGKLPDAAS